MSIEKPTKYDAIRAHYDSLRFNGAGGADMDMLREIDPSFADDPVKVFEEARESAEALRKFYESRQESQESLDSNKPNFCGDCLRLIDRGNSCAHIRVGKRGGVTRND